jgi:catechol 2,3-dioxygenase-like lactoylglutathione lyase family enzyme
MLRIPFSLTAVLVVVALSVSAVAAEAQSADASSEPEITMSSVALNVTDIATSEKFYNEVFGLERTFEFESQGNLIEIGLGRPGGGGMGFLLAHFNDDPLPEGRTAYGRIVVNVSDAKAVAKRATDRGSTISQDMVIGNGAHLIFFDDPDGYEIELYEAP